MRKCISYSLNKIDCPFNMDKMRIIVHPNQIALLNNKCMKARERERGTHTHTHTETERERQADRQTDRQTNG